MFVWCFYHLGIVSLKEEVAACFLCWKRESIILNMCVFVTLLNLQDLKSIKLAKVLVMQQASGLPKINLSAYP